MRTAGIAFTDMPSRNAVVAEQDMIVRFGPVLFGIIGESSAHDLLLNISKNFRLTLFPVPSRFSPELTLPLILPLNFIESRRRYSCRGRERKVSGDLPAL